MPPISILQRLAAMARPAKPHPVDEMCVTYRLRLAQWAALPAPPARSLRVGVVITPWLASGVPIFSLECALGLRQAGARVKIFWDASNLMGNAPHHREAEPLAALLRQLPADVEYITVAEHEEFAAADDGGLCEAILHENAIHRMRGESRIGDFMEQYPEALQATRRHLAKVHQLLRVEPLDFVLIPGGVYGLSAVYLAAAQRLGLAVTTYDCDYGMHIFAHGGVACHQVDLVAAAELLEKYLLPRPAERKRIIAAAEAELQARMEGRDALRSQEVAAARNPEGDYNILVPLNLRWDTAALSRQRLFASVEDWVLALLAWAETEPDARICFRQHPGERFEAAHCVDDVGALISRHNRVGDRVRFVAAADKVSTYDILRTVKVVLPFTGTVGVEAGMLGHPAIISTQCYYGSFPFACSAETRADYFHLVHEALSDHLPVTSEAREKASLLYYLTALCNMVKTSFTAAPNDVLEWLQVSPQELWLRPENVDLVEALMTRSPLAFIRARRFAEEAEAHAAA